MIYKTALLFCIFVWAPSQAQQVPTERREPVVCTLVNDSSGVKISEVSVVNGTVLLTFENELDTHIGVDVRFNMPPSRIEWDATRGQKDPEGGFALISFGLRPGRERVVALPFADTRDAFHEYVQVNTSGGIPFTMSALSCTDVSTLSQPVD